MECGDGSTYPGGGGGREAYYSKVIMNIVIIWHNPLNILWSTVRISTAWVHLCFIGYFLFHYFLLAPKPFHYEQNGGPSWTMIMRPLKTLLNDQNVPLENWIKNDFEWNSSVFSVWDCDYTSNSSQLNIRFTNIFKFTDVSSPET